MNKRFTGKVVIITGASSGFGAAMARAFTDAGAQVVPASRTTGCDVSRRKDVDNLITQTFAKFGRIDILINNAGIGLRAPFEQTEIADAQALFDVNFFGAFHCVQAVLPQRRVRSIFLRAAFAALLACGVGQANASGPYSLTNGTYFCDFTDITNWVGGFTSGIGATNWASVAVAAGGTIPNGTNITVATTTFQSAASSSSADSLVSDAIS